MPQALSRLLLTSSCAIPPIPLRWNVFLLFLCGKLQPSPSYLLLNIRFSKGSLLAISDMSFALRALSFRLSPMTHTSSAGFTVLVLLFSAPLPHRLITPRDKRTLSGCLRLFSSVRTVAVLRTKSKANRYAAVGLRS